MKFRIVRMLNVAVALIYAVVILFFFLAFILSGENELRVIYPSLIICLGILSAFSINCEMRLSYLQNNPNEECRFLKSIGFMRIKEDFVRIYPNEKISKMYQICFDICLISFVWVIIEIIIDANK